MHQNSCWRLGQSLAIAASIAVLVACDANPTSPDAKISFNPVNACAGLNGSFAAPTLVVFRDTAHDSVSFTGNPALVLNFSDGRFTSTVFASGLPPITNVGSFSISGGYVILGERPLVPRLAITSQRFNCQLTGTRLVLGNDDALFDFGSGRFEPARVHVELSRR